MGIALVISVLALPYHCFLSALPYFYIPLGAAWTFTLFDIFRYLLFPLPPRGAVFITGTSTGIGRQAAERFAALGFRVFASVRSEKHFDELKRCGIQPILMDVTNEAQVRAMLAKNREQKTGKKKKTTPLSILFR
jgi:NADPH:quinone reductase-like Zn-dependent oxidoreductase